jgi:hypothetical protein
MALGEKSEQAFELFVSNATVGALQPLDSERWNRFIVAVRLDGESYDDIYDEVRRRLFMADFPEIGSQGIEYLTGRVSDGLELLEVWEQVRTGG